MLCIRQTPNCAASWANPWHRSRSTTRCCRRRRRRPWKPCKHSRPAIGNTPVEMNSEQFPITSVRLVSIRILRPHTPAWAPLTTIWARACCRKKTARRHSSFAIVRVNAKSCTSCRTTTPTADNSTRELPRWSSTNRLIPGIPLLPTTFPAFTTSWGNTKTPSTRREKRSNSSRTPSVVM